MARSKVAGGLVLVGLGFGCSQGVVDENDPALMAMRCSFDLAYCKADVVKPAVAVNDPNVEVRFSDGRTAPSTAETVKRALGVASASEGDVDLFLPEEGLPGLSTQSTGRSKPSQISIRVNTGKDRKVGGCVQTKVDFYHATKIMDGKKCIIDMHFYYYRHPTTGTRCWALYMSGVNYSREKFPDVCYCGDDVEPPDEEAIRDYCKAQERALYVEPEQAVQSMGLPYAQERALFYTYVAITGAALMSTAQAVTAALPACMLDLTQWPKMPSGTGASL
jgi:hypothetical protein